MRRLNLCFCGISSLTGKIKSRGRIKGRAGRLNRTLAPMAWSSFVIALVSGVILSFNYSPTGDVFASVSRLTHLYPFGAFFRQLHYLSGQFFLICTTLHILDHFFKSTYLHMKPLMWSRLVVTFCLGFPLMFTGFILKGDKEGIFAGEIMMHLAGGIPILGSLTADLLILPGPGFFLRPYLYHTVILPLLTIFLLTGHQRSLVPGKKIGGMLLAVLIPASALWPLPLDIPPRAEPAFVEGPWFFQGLQLLLRWVPPFWAGVILPLAPLCIMVCLPFVPALWAGWGRRVVIALGAVHMGLLMVAWIILPGFAGGGG